MRLLHTSDWHLGRTFHGASLHRAQAAIVDELVTLATDAAVDAVVVAGDLFDRAVPPLEAVALFDDAISRLRSTGALVVAVSGNHDSAPRVGVHDRLLTQAGVTIRGDVRRSVEPVLVTPARGGDPVAIYPLPYLDPPASTFLLDGDAREQDNGSHHGASNGTPMRRPTHDMVTRAATARIRADLSRRPGTRSVVVAHTFVVGGRPSDSERDLSMGNIEHVVLDAFDGFDYVALGHLHGPQAFAEGRVAYSGSPLPYSFSEERHHKSVRLVELAPDGGLSVERIPLDVGMSVRSVTGRLDQLLTDPTLDEAVPAFVRATLTDTELPRQAMARLRRRFPGVVELRHAPEGRLLDPVSPHRRERRDTAPLDLTRRFWTHQHGAPPTPGELQLLETALAAASRGEAPDGGGAAP